MVSGVSSDCKSIPGKYERQAAIQVFYLLQVDFKHQLVTSPLTFFPRSVKLNQPYEQECWCLLRCRSFYLEQNNSEVATVDFSG